MKLLKEMKGVQFTLDLLVYYGFQQYIRSTDSPLFEQPTLPDLMQRRALGAAATGGAHGPVKIMTRKVHTPTFSCSAWALGMELVCVSRARIWFVANKFNVFDGGCLVCSTIIDL